MATENIEQPTFCPACGDDHRQHGICQSCGKYTDWEYAGGWGRGRFIRRCESCGREHRPKN